MTSGRKSSINSEDLEEIRCADPSETNVDLAKRLNLALSTTASARKKFGPFGDDGNIPSTLRSATRSFELRNKAFREHLAEIDVEMDAASRASDEVLEKRLHVVSLHFKCLAMEASTLSLTVEEMSLLYKRAHIVREMESRTRDDLAQGLLRLFQDPNGFLAERNMEEVDG